MSADGGWQVVLPRFGFGLQVRVPFASHAEALAYAVAERDRRVAAVSVYATPGFEVWAPWTLRVVRR